MSLIYHITTKEAWNRAKEKGAYEATSLADEGFIHCAQEHQVQGVLERYFSGQQQLVKLIIETDLLKSRFIFEWSPSTSDTFPHIYGPIDTEAVVDVVSI
jgi:uncharacterized protein (DUF952 family)